MAAIDTVTEQTLEQALEINGDVVSNGETGLLEVQLADVLNYTGELTISGALDINGDFTIEGDAGSDSQVLLSQGGGAPIWTDQTELNAGQIDDLDSTQFLRSDTSDVFTSGVLSFSDNTLLDLSSISHNDTSVQGLLLPQGATLQNPSTNEGYIAYDTSQDKVVFYDGTAWQNVSTDYTGWIVSDSSNTENITSGSTLIFEGGDGIATDYTNATNTMQIDVNLIGTGNNTSSNSGLQFDNGQLGILQGCVNGKF